MTPSTPSPARDPYRDWNERWNEPSIARLLAVVLISLFVLPLVVLCLPLIFVHRYFCPPK